MKKILSLLLIVAMIATMCCACSKKEPDVQDTAPPPSSETEKTPDETTTPESPTTEPSEPEVSIEKLEGDDRMAFETFLATVIISGYEEAPYAAIGDYLVHGNVSCYVDNADVSTYAESAKVTLDNCRNEFYQYNDEARQVKGVEYTNTAGNMFGFTVTFYPQDVDGVRCYVVKDGILNQFVRDNADVKYHKEVAPDYSTNGTFGTMIDSAMFDMVVSVMGETIPVSTDRYKNSPVTAFFYINEMGMLNATYSFGGEFIEK